MFVDIVSIFELAVNGVIKMFHYWVLCEVAANNRSTFETTFHQLAHDFVTRKSTSFLNNQ